MSTRPDAEELLHSWTTWMRAAGLSERTIESWPAHVRRAARFAGADPAELTAEDLSQYLSTFTNANTKSTYFIGLRAWHDWLVKFGHRVDDPTARLRRPRKPAGVPHPVSTAGLQQLLASDLTERARAMVLLAAYQGLRVHEIAKIRGQDIDLENGVLRVSGKGGKDALLPLHPEVVKLAEQYPRRGHWFPSQERPGHPVAPRTVTSHISFAMRRAGVEGVPHGLRHWFATSLLREGVDVRSVQVLMRHSSLSATQGYLQFDDRGSREAIGRLPVLHSPADGKP